MKEDIFEINGTTYKVIIDDSGNKTVCKKLKNGSFNAEWYPASICIF